MNLILKAPTLEDLQKVREWRNEDLSFLRTSFLLTEEHQIAYYKRITDRKNNVRMWCFYEKNIECFVAFGGLENIEWENRLAEISIIVDWQYRTQDYGKEAVAKILEQGFEYLNLENIFGECYRRNSIAIKFWQDIIKKYDGYSTELPKRKYWDGTYWNSMYFNINKSKWAKCES